MLPLAIRSKAILPGAVPCVFRRDEQAALVQQQNGSVEFPDCLAASQCFSRPKVAVPELIVLPKPADDSGCVADVWVLLHGLAFAAEPARVACLVPTHSW